MSKSRPGSTALARPTGSAASAAKSISEPLVLDLDNPAVADAVTDMGKARCWKLLDESECALTASQVAEAQGIGLSAAQRALDTLVDAGFVERLKARSGARAISYRGIKREILIGWDPDSSSHQAIMTALRLGLRSLSRSILDTYDGPHVPPAPRRRGSSFFTTFEATAEDARALLSTMRDLSQPVEQAAARARAVRNAAANEAPSAAEQSSSAQIATYHLAVELRMVGRDAPRTPGFLIWNRDTVRQLADARKSAPAALLSPRELEVARRLASGESRATIASTLGMRVNTVLTTCKRIHRKLGVHNRAELVARMRPST